MTQPLRFGLIGVSATGGWARESHVPAIQGLAGLELAAVAAGSQASANAAATAFGVGKAYANGLALIADPAIDAVTVATRVPDHRDLVFAALAAGKHVYSEWPLGRGAAEAEEMARAARAAGVRTAIGLQLRANRVVQHARDLLLSGAVGRLLSLHVRSAAAGFGPDVAKPFAYLEDPANFANLVTIQGGHTIDLVLALAGPLTGLQALGSAQFREIRVGEAREARRRTTFDHLLVQARLTDGAALSVEVSGGRPPDTPFLFEAIGETGVVRLKGGAPRGFQSGRVRLSVDGAPVKVDEGEVSPMPDAAANVAGVYAALRDSIHAGRGEHPGFDHAAHLSRLIEDLLASAQTASWMRAYGWPAG